MESCPFLFACKLLISKTTENKQSIVIGRFVVQIIYNFSFGIIEGQIIDKRTHYITLQSHELITEDFLRSSIKKLTTEGQEPFVSCLFTKSLL